MQMQQGALGSLAEIIKSQNKLLQQTVGSQSNQPPATPAGPPTGGMPAPGGQTGAGGRANMLMQLLQNIQQRRRSIQPVAGGGMGAGVGQALTGRRPY